MCAAPLFALIGHQDSWDRLSRIVNHLRDPSRAPLPLETLQETVPWIPPRAILMSRNQSLRGGTVEGVYVETFLTPEELGGTSVRRAIQRVAQAIEVAVARGARIAALGGFTSILLEGREGLVPRPPGLALTTGNSLTAAFIVKSVERAALRLDIPLAEATLLVIGASGDVGSACARYFTPRVGRLLLTARRADRLEQLARTLGGGPPSVHWSTDTTGALPRADIIIAAASTSHAMIDLAGCRPGALVCDAGYPKNLRPPAGIGVHLFHGGMGQALAGWTSDSLLSAFYDYPAPHVGHGCLLEGIVLAMEGRFESYSCGRGLITPGRIEEIFALAASHGIVPAPFFNHDGLWPEGQDAWTPAAVGR